MSEATRKRGPKGPAPKSRLTELKSKAATKAAPMKKVAAKTAPTKAAPVTAPVPVPKVTAVGSEAAYLRYLPHAEKLAAGEVLPYRLDPVLAYHNVQTGLAALGPYRDALKRALPLLDHTALFDLGELAQAVVFAATQVEGKTRSLGETRTLLTEASQLRALLLSTAEALALSGIFKAQAIDKIRSGSGPIDLARDCIELAALFGKSEEAMKAQKLVRSEQLQRASELGTLLVGRLKPGGARKKEAERSDAAQVTARDRLATLLWQRFRDLRKAAYYLWGDAFDTQVPALQTRQRAHASRPKSPASPTPPSGA